MMNIEYRILNLFGILELRLVIVCELGIFI